MCFCRKIITQKRNWTDYCCECLDISQILSTFAADI